MASEIERQILEYRKGKAVLVYGPSGCGKTFLVRNFAEKNGYELIEIDSSEKRDAEAFGKLAFSSMQKSLFNRKKLFLVDDIDSLQARGAIPALVDLIKKSSFPVVLIALDPWKQKFKPVRACAAMSRIRKPSYLQVRKLLREHCLISKITCDEDALEEISRQSNGNYSSAFNDLNTAVSGSRLVASSLRHLGKREEEGDVFEVLNSIFKGTGFESFDDLMGLNMELDSVILWLAENISLAYKEREQVAEAYYWISRASQMLNRARKKNEYRFYYYASLMLSAGVSCSGKAGGYLAFKPSSRIRKFFLAKSRRAMLREISGKIAGKCHTSERTAAKEYLPFLKFFDGNDSGLFDKDELLFIKSI